MLAKNLVVSQLNIWCHVHIVNICPLCSNFRVRWKTCTRGTIWMSHPCSTAQRSPCTKTQYMATGNTEISTTSMASMWWATVHLSLRADVVIFFSPLFLNLPSLSLHVLFSHKLTVFLLSSKWPPLKVWPSGLGEQKGHLFSLEPSSLAHRDMVSISSRHKAFSNSEWT